jgi:hypothetical protein
MQNRSNNDLSAVQILNDDVRGLHFTAGTRRFPFLAPSINKRGKALASRQSCAANCILALTRILVPSILR